MLIVHSENALAPDLADAFYSAVQSPKQELWLESHVEIDFYDDSDGSVEVRLADSGASKVRHRGN